MDKRRISTVVVLSIIICVITLGAIVASSVVVFSIANLDKGSGEKWIDEGCGKSVIALVALPFIGFASASEMQGDEGGSGVLRGGASSIEEEKGIAKYTNVAQEIDLLKTKTDNYNDAQNEMKALSSSTISYENFTMLIGEKKCSSTHKYYSPGRYSWYCDTSGCPSVIMFSSKSLASYCIKILEEAKPGIYEFQVSYHWKMGWWGIGSLPLRHKINITVNITECQNCTILTGVVTNVKDNPIYNAKIYVEKRDYESIDYYTDDTGFYSTGPLRNGRYTVSVSPPSGVNLLDKVLTANITQNATLNITLQCGGILTGKVMDTNGTPVYNAEVSVSAPTTKWGYTDINGTYSIIRLKNGTYSVTITPPNGANLLKQKTTANVTECQTTYLNSTLQFGGILKGRVTYENGTGIYNARVKASGPSYPSYKSTYTNTTGYYCIVGLLAGNYTVTAYPPSGANLLSNSKTTSVNLEETIIMDLILQRENQPPIASFSYSPERIVVNEITAFNASSSYDLDGIITNYEWNFGDGNNMYTTHEIINHFYSSTGNYNVTLTITDNDDATDSTKRTVIVNPNISWNMTISATDQLESVVVGMHPNATDGYDAEYDVFVQTPIHGKVMLILDDIYSTSIKRTRRYSDSVTWNLSVEVPTGPATTLSWRILKNPLEEDS